MPYWTQTFPYNLKALKIIIKIKILFLKSIIVIIIKGSSDIVSLPNKRKIFQDLSNPSQIFGNEW